MNNYDLKYDQIFELLQKEIKNNKARSIILSDSSGHPLPLFATKDSLLKLVIQLLKTIKDYNNNECEEESGKKYTCNAEIEDALFNTVSDPWIQSIYIFKDYKDMFSKILKWKMNEGDQAGIDSLNNDPALSINNFE